jgi:hypothetical protein
VTSTAAAPPITPGIVVARERLLDLRSHPEGRYPHVAAGSGIVRLPANDIVVADDELYVASFPRSGAPGTMHRVFPGTLPADNKARKKVKPDIEAVALAHGATKLLGLGSGSTDQRTRGFVQALDSSGLPTGTPRILDLTDLYKRIDHDVAGTLNIEGVVVHGGDALLFHRGNSKGGRNAIARVAAARLLAGSESEKVDGSALRGVVPYELGSIDGVPLTFADACGLPDGRIIFLASAEDTDSAHNDGPIVGTAVGIIGADGALGKMWNIEGPPRKLEGIDVSFAADGAPQMALVSDHDDPKIPAELLRATLPADLLAELQTTAAGNHSTA